MLEKSQEHPTPRAALERTLRLLKLPMYDTTSQYSSHSLALRSVTARLVGAAVPLVFVEVEVEVADSSVTESEDGSVVEVAESVLKTVDKTVVGVSEGGTDEGPPLVMQRLSASTKSSTLMPGGGASNPRYSPSRRKSASGYCIPSTVQATVTSRTGSAGTAGVAGAAGAAGAPGAEGGAGADGAPGVDGAAGALDALAAEDVAEEGALVDAPGVGACAALARPGVCWNFSTGTARPTFKRAKI